MKLTYTPKGVCSKEMELEVHDGVIKSLQVSGGCHGNLQGLSRLVEGMDAKEVITRLSGICCGFKNTSCPDQLSRALEKLLNTAET